MLTLTEHTPLHSPPFYFFEDAGITYAIDAEGPNWIAVEQRGAEVLGEIAREPLTFGALVSRYASRHGLEAGKAWLHVHDFLAALNRTSMLFDEPVRREPYAGRAAYIRPNGLRELWLQINNACNLSCTHCLVSSGPSGIVGMQTEEIVAAIDGAGALGV